MDFLPQSITELISEFSHLPGIGQKTAERLTFFLLRPHRSLNQDLARALLGLKDNLHFCEMCHNLSSEAICKICSDVHRDKTTICVVEEALDAVALEKTHEYHGVYHVLHGALSPLNGIGPNDLTIVALKDRVEKADPKIEEIIL
ncbi:recombination protein RecR, partial [Candidatus Peregrinibacteria bacterium]|nr:recombination protein RecR [Candidatus Peregrinibacteria bacterium]